MKKILTALLAALLLLGCTAMAETAADPAAITDALIQNISALSSDQLAQIAQAVQTEQAARGATQPAEAAPLQKGDNSPEVQKLQQRLIELNYLSGSADGDFGGKTQTAVQLFQTAAGLPASGIADAATQEALYADDAPVREVYLPLDFKAVSRDPDTYTGKKYEFTGYVLQVLEQSYDSYTEVEMRIATNDRYDDVVYVTYAMPTGTSRILEDDKVNISCVCKGLYTYESIMGGSITLPIFEAESVSIL